MNRFSTKFFTFFALILFVPGISLALKYKGAKDGSGKKPAGTPSVMAGCSPATSKKDLDINNTKALIHSGGDMWWDLIGAARYEIPKKSGKMSLFAGALWMGGKDVSGQLKVAGQRFRSNGNDYWTGPLSTKNAEISPETCSDWDKHFLTTRDEVSQFIAWYQAGIDDGANGTTTQQENFPNYQIPQSILDWPAHGRNFDPYDEDFYLAPFFDNPNSPQDRIYDPKNQGDYPAYDFSSQPTCTQGKIDKIYGDQNLWWIFNDKGNVHTETGSNSIGMEIRAQAFAFATSDEVNNMTFYNYELYNRSSYTLTETYFGQWVDADLGGPSDDYVGCDVQRGLGYCYNGDEMDADDGGAKGYGSQPPAIGVDFFQGPYQDNDESDNPLYTASDPIKVLKIEFLDGISTKDSLKITTSVNHNLESTTGSVVVDVIKISGNMQSVADTGTISDLKKYIREYKLVKVRKVTDLIFVFWTTSASDPDTLSKYATGVYINPGTDNLLLNQIGLKEIQDQMGIPYKGIGIGYGDGVKDNERFGMRKFLYHDNAQTVVGDPEKGVDYYNYLKGYWKDGTRMIYGGNGKGTNGIPADYMFPDDSDPIGWGNYNSDGSVGNIQAPWNEVTAGNTPADRRFMQSAGPFTLGPGAVNNITVGVVWAQATAGGRWQSVQEVRKADDKTQAMFDNCFQVLNGPDAPELAFREMDKELILYISNKSVSNNFNEQYQEKDIFLGDPSTIDTDNDGIDDYQLTEKEKAEFGLYKFQGYLVYQVKDQSVSSGDLRNPEKARLVLQCDIVDSVKKIVNKYYSAEVSSDVPVLEVDGADKGIVHSFQITEDKFAVGDKRLVNHKKVYFLAIAYGYNYSPYNAYLQDIEKQKKPFIGSRKAATGGIKVFTAIPHKTSMQLGGNTPNSVYGDEMQLTRLEGAGNGGKAIYLTTESREEALTGRVKEIVYEKGKGPVSIKVIDPLLVPAADFHIEFLDSITMPSLTDIDNRIDSAGYWWYLWENGKYSEGKLSTVAISLENEQLMPDWGISVKTKQVSYPRIAPESPLYEGDFLEATMTFADPSKPWLSGVSDAEGYSAMNWIRSGTSVTAEDDPETQFNEIDFNDRYYGDNIFLDDKQIYEKVLGGTWAPFALCAQEPHGPLPYKSGTFNNGSSYSPAIGSFQLKYLYSVDIVFTSDKTKWTRCPVLEMGKDTSLTSGVIVNGIAKYQGAIMAPQTLLPSYGVKGFIRSALSVDKNGKPYDTTGLAFSYSIDSIPYSTDGIPFSIDSILYLKELKSTNPEAANFISPLGMGWFPGYAVNVETGERLNIAFGEDSWLGAENGRDMLWNPTTKLYDQPYLPGFIENWRLGGKHYIFIFRNNIVEDTASIKYPKDRMPAYDNGAFMFKQLSKAKRDVDAEFKNVYRSAMWVGLPLLAQGESLLSTDAMVSIRVARPFENYGTGTFLSYYDTITHVRDKLTIGKPYFVDKGPVIHNGVTYVHGQSFKAKNDSFNIDNIILNYTIILGDTVDTDTINDLMNNLVFNPDINSANYGRPIYSFSTRDYAADTNQSEVMVDALKLINVVPNPYYAYSEYETDKVDNRIKIINLPQKCEISIYTTNGTLVRKYFKDDPTITSVDWDLKNNVRIPIASGLYIIHVKVPDVGERTLKWMGIMRPVDVDSF